MSEFAIRGYIEGFYGKPWTAQQRLTMLELMASLGENTYYYAPKDDPYHRKLWREKYPPEQLQCLTDAVQKAGECGMEFNYCIAPGLSMRYSSEEDFQALCEKTSSLFAEGIRHFGLLLDDIPEELFYEEDRRLFGNTAAAHIALCLRFRAFLTSLSEDCVLTVCPLQYHGKGTEDYISRFASAMPEDVRIFFTGPDICSKELTARDAKLFYETTGHKPLYWDNFPVNDAEMFKEMHLAPVIGREPALADYAEGVISNCMEYFECSKLPLYTVAAFLRDPDGYDPEQAFRQATEAFVPEELREDFILFADHLRTSCLNDENSRIMGETLSKASILSETGDPQKALAVVSEYAAKIRRSAEGLKNADLPLLRELSEWLNKYALMSEILNDACEVLNGGGDKAALSAEMKRYNDCATVLTAFCFREFIEAVLEG